MIDMERNVPKKEKGTYKAPIDSAKNQLQCTKKDSIEKQNVLILLDNLENELNRKLTYSINDNDIREFKSYIEKTKHIKRIAIKDPRFPYKIIQQKLDNLYRDDKSIKEIIIMFSINELINTKTFNPKVYGV